MNASNKILVVEDDWDINALLCKILSQNVTRDMRRRVNKGN